jgi:hypothetical protein
VSGVTSITRYLSRIEKFRHLTLEQVGETQRLVDRRYRFLEAIAGI